MAILSLQVKALQEGSASRWTDLSRLDSVRRLHLTPLRAHYNTSLFYCRRFGCSFIPLCSFCWYPILYFSYIFRHCHLDARDGQVHELNKNGSEDELCSTVQLAYKHDWHIASSFWFKEQCWDTHRLFSY